MKKKRAFLFAFLVIIVVVSGLALISASERFLFSKHLEVLTIAQSSEGLPEVNYYANITDAETYVGSIFRELNMIISIILNIGLLLMWVTWRIPSWTGLI